jgi:hypothetical protein
MTTPQRYLELAKNLNWICGMTGEGEEVLTTLREAATLQSQVDALKKDAERYRWLKQYACIASDSPGDWTCWLALEQICVRRDPKKRDAQELLDELIARFPIDAAIAGENK